MLPVCLSVRRPSWQVELELVVAHRAKVNVHRLRVGVRQHHHREGPYPVVDEPSRLAASKGYDLAWSPSVHADDVAIAKSLVGPDDYSSIGSGEYEGVRMLAEPRFPGHYAGRDQVQRGTPERGPSMAMPQGCAHTLLVSWSHQVMALMKRPPWFPKVYASPSILRS